MVLEGTIYNWGLPRPTSWGCFFTSNDPRVTQWRWYGWYSTVRGCLRIAIYSTTFDTLNITHIISYKKLGSFHLPHTTSSFPLAQFLIPSHTDVLSIHVPSLHVKSLGAQVARKHRVLTIVQWLVLNPLKMLLFVETLSSNLRIGSCTVYVMLNPISFSLSSVWNLRYRSVPVDVSFCG